MRRDNARDSLRTALLKAGQEIRPEPDGPSAIHIACYLTRYKAEPTHTRVEVSAEPRHSLFLSTQKRSDTASK
jgi:hypothetical protein